MKQLTDQRGIAERIKQLIFEKSISLTTFGKKVGISPSNLSKKVRGKQPWTLADIRKVCDTFDVPYEWLEFGEGDYGRKEDEEATRSIKPRLPITAAAGPIQEYVHGVRMSECSFQPVVKSFPEYDFTIIVQGNSMEPKFEGGDEIACKKVSSMVEWGKTYLVEAREGTVLKRLYDEGNEIRCVSYNHEEYPDFLISKSDIFGIYKVVGLLRV